MRPSTEVGLVDVQAGYCLACAVGEEQGCLQDLVTRLSTHRRPRFDFMKFRLRHVPSLVTTLRLMDAPSGISVQMPLGLSMARTTTQYANYSFLISAPVRLRLEHVETPARILHCKSVGIVWKIVLFTPWRGNTEGCLGYLLVSAMVPPPTTRFIVCLIQR